MKFSDPGTLTNQDDSWKVPRLADLGFVAVLPSYRREKGRRDRRDSGIFRGVLLAQILGEQGKLGAGNSNAFCIFYVHPEPWGRWDPF